MKTFPFSLVNVFLFFFNETHCSPTNPPPFGSRTKTAVGQPSGSRPLLGRFPAAMSCNATNGHVQFAGSDDPDNDVPLLSASVNNYLRPTEWQDIFNMENNLADNFEYSKDSLQQESTFVQSIYVDTLILLLRKVHEWLNSDEQKLDTIDYYLGYDEETIGLINYAMTELYTAKRNSVKKRNMNSLEAFFYYSCDIGRIDKNENTVKQNLTRFIKLFELQMEYITQLDEVSLKKDLIMNLNYLLRKTNASFNVSVKSMKMRILSDTSRDELINSIQNRSVSPSLNMRKTIRELVESYATETDGAKVNAYHVNTMGFLIPDIFGYAYNHFELLYRLESFDIDGTDKKIIEKFSPFMGSFISIFLYRFFEFKGELSMSVMYEMSSVRYFLDPSEDLNTGQANKSILNYYEKSERIEVIEEHMKTIMEKALEITLSACTGEYAKDWKVTRSSRIVYPQKSNDKSTLIRLIKENQENAFKILDTFKRELGNTN